MPLSLIKFEFLLPRFIIKIESCRLVLEQIKENQEQNIQIQQKQETKQTKNKSKNKKNQTNKNKTKK
jgi:hypothetical protein